MVDPAWREAYYAEEKRYETEYASLQEAWLVNDRSIPLRVRLEVMVDVAKALNYLHTSNPPMLHNDLRRYGLRTHE